SGSEMPWWPGVFDRGRVMVAYRGLLLRRCAGGRPDSSHYTIPLLGVVFETARTAATIPWYPVQRQMFPESPSRISSSLGEGFSRSSAVADMMNPGVQKPH